MPPYRVKPAPKRVLVKPIRRTCFISYHHADNKAVNDFIDRFGPRNFIKRGITMPEEIVNSTNPDYVMRKIRERFLENSTVTIVLVGRHTWGRRFVDWEVQSSLRPPISGLLAIALVAAPRLPHRVALNVESGYAHYHSYPRDARTLGQWIEDAYGARDTRARLRVNPRERRLRNAPIPRGRYFP